MFTIKLLMLSQHLRSLSINKKKTFEPVASRTAVGHSPSKLQRRKSNYCTQKRWIKIQDTQWRAEEQK